MTHNDSLKLSLLSFVNLTHIIIKWAVVWRVMWPDASGDVVAEIA